MVCGLTCAPGLVTLPGIAGHQDRRGIDVIGRAGPTRPEARPTAARPGTRRWLICSVKVDGYELTNRGPYSCFLDVDFEQLRPSLAAARPASPTPSPSPKASAPPPPVAATPAGCRYVTEGEVTSIMMAKYGTLKPVVSVGGDAERCTYVFDRTTGRVTFSWTAGGKPDSAIATRVTELDVPAYWLDIVPFRTLQVQLPKGMFEVVVEFNDPKIDQKATAIEFFKIARPRLP
jgi:hypothetical protein